MKIDNVFCFALIDLMHPLLLLFAIGALIPILIQYWHRQQHPRMSWAATHYLQLALGKVSRRYSILQWLLLALRVAVVLLLAVAVAGPLFENPSNLFSGPEGVTRLRIIVVDTSFSMSAESQNVSRQSEAKRIASELVEQKQMADSFVVFTFDETLTARLANPTGSPNEILAVIDSIASTQYAGQIKNTINELSERCRSDVWQSFDQIEIHLISDFASKDWDPVDEEIESSWTKLTQQVNIAKRYSVSTSSLSNNFVSNVSSPDSISIVNRSFPVDVELQNRGGDASQDLTVELMVNDQVAESRTVSLKPDQKMIVRFDVEFDQPGEQLVEARINPDNLNADNRRFLTVESRQRFRVLFLEGRPRGSRFLQIALDPEQSADSIYDFQVAKADDLSVIDLDQIDVVFWDNIRQLNESSVKRLKRFVSYGGLMLMFMGDLVDRPRFNQMWNEDSEASFQLQIDRLQPVDNYEVDPLQYKSEFMSAFRGNPQAGLEGLPIWAYYRVGLESDSEWVVELALTNGDPLLLSRKYGKGALLFFASSSSSDSRTRNNAQNPNGIAWNANEANPVFPALVQELFLTLSKVPVRSTSLVGDFATGQFEARMGVNQSSLFGLKGIELDSQQFEVETTQQDDQVSWRSETLTRAGFYRYSAKTNSAEYGDNFAVNLDTNESDLRSETGMAESENELDHRSQTTLGGDLYPWQLFQWILGLLAVLVVVESVLGYRFGKGNG